jgi:eukaryotic-like serine/threonine-protein kinase
VLNPERWQLVERIFHEALARPAVERTAFLETSCAGDDGLKQEVASLLDFADRLEADPGKDGAPGALAAAVAAEWAGASGQAMVGREVGGYVVKSLIGTGGMGETYLAEDVSLGRRVALKFLPRAFSTDAIRVQRFIEEARAASALNHPGILTVYATGECEGQRYIATEFIEGETLRKRLAKGPLAPAAAMEIAIQAAEALATAHRAGIIHRDIKPENIMIRPDGYVKIIDFGLAKPVESGEGRQRALSRVGDVMGTIDYMAPEQAAGATVDARADVYSLTVVFYEMLTGELPRELGSGSGGGKTGRPSPATRRLIRRGLASDPDKRLQTAAEFLSGLEELRGRISRPRRWWWWSAIAAMLLVAMVAGYRWWSARHAASEFHSLLVMPLRPLGGSDQSHLEEGMSEAMITRLGSLRNLRVTSGASLKPGDNPFEAAKRLGLDAILTGSVQRSGDRLRVTAQLSRTANREQIWAGQYDEVFTSIFSIQDSIAEKVATSLVSGITASDRALLERHETQNSEAYDIYLRARQQWDMRTPPAIRAAIDMYRRAIAIEPDFALAYAGLADSYNLAASGMAPLTRGPLARAAAERALEIDPQSAEAHTALAFQDYKFEWKWDEADREFRRAIALNPHYALAHHWYGEMLKLEMRHEESIAQFRSAVEADPFSVPIRYDFILALLNAGRVAEARGVLDETKAIDPAAERVYRAEAEVLEAEGKLKESVEAGFHAELLAGKAHAPTGLAESEIEALRAAYRRGGIAALNQRRVDLLLARLKPGTNAPSRMATDLSDAYARLGDRKGTLRWLEEAVRLHEDEALLIMTHRFDFLRQDPELIGIEKRVGFIR